MENNVKRNLIRVFVKGGFLSPVDLLRIMEVSRTLGNKYIMFGSRQDIMFPSNGADDQVLQEAFNGIRYRIRASAAISPYTRTS